MTFGFEGATAMSMRPSWLPTVDVIDVLTYAVPLPACICAPVPYGLPVTCVPNTKPLSSREMSVNVGQPLAGIVAE